MAIAERATAGATPNRIKVYVYCVVYNIPFDLQPDTWMGVVGTLL